jgi:hypothetical protein
MASEVIAWNSHEWSDRLIRLESGLAGVQHICRTCARTFFTDERTGARYAVHVGIGHLDRLSDKTTERWLLESCPGQIRADDYEDLKTRY